MQPADRTTPPRRPLEPSTSGAPGARATRARATAAAAAVLLLVLPLVPAPAGAADGGGTPKPHEPASGQAAPEGGGEQVGGGGGDPARPRACCQYVCRDKVSDFLLVVCVERAGCPESFNFAQCQLLARNDVASCKECTPRLERGRESGGDGHCPKPAEEKKPDAAPGGGGGGETPKH